MTTAKSTLPTRQQFVFLSAVGKRGIERREGKSLSCTGTPWSTQKLCEERGWVTTRAGRVAVWERWYTLTPEGEAAYEAYLSAGQERRKAAVAKVASAHDGVQALQTAHAAGTLHLTPGQLSDVKEALETLHRLYRSLEETAAVPSARSPLASSH